MRSARSMASRRGAVLAWDTDARVPRFMVRQEGERRSPNPGLRPPIPRGDEEDEAGPLRLGPGPEPVVGDRVVGVVGPAGVAPSELRRRAPVDCWVPVFAAVAYSCECNRCFSLLFLVPSVVYPGGLSLATSEGRTGVSRVEVDVRKLSHRYRLSM